MWKFSGVLSLLCVCFYPFTVSASQSPGAAAPDHAVAQQKTYRIKTDDDVNLHVVVAGDGPPCIYVHGGPGQGTQSFRGMNGNRLETMFTMIYVDQRGAGGSDSATDYGLDRVVSDLDEVRSAIGYNKVYLLAHSFGGIRARDIARIDAMIQLKYATPAISAPTTPEVRQ